VERASIPVLAPARRQSIPLTPVLLLSSVELDRHFTVDLLKGSKYVLACADNWYRAQNLVSHMVFPIIMYDRLFDSNDWRPGVKRLVSCSGRPVVLLLSQTWDVDLRDELVRSGGFDVLVRPVECDFLRVLDVATARFNLSTPHPQPFASSCADSAALGQEKP
jgi:hypothetical protein